MADKKINIDVSLKSMIQSSKEDYKTLIDKKVFNSEQGQKQQKELKDLFDKIDKTDWKEVNKGGVALENLVKHLTSLNSIIEKATNSLFDYTEEYKKQQKEVKKAEENLEKAKEKRSEKLAAKKEAAQGLKFDNKHTFFNADSGRQVKNPETIAELYNAQKLQIRGETGKNAVSQLDFQKVVANTGIDKFALASKEYEEAKKAIDQEGGFTDAVKKATAALNAIEKPKSADPGATGILNRTQDNKKALGSIKDEENLRKEVNLTSELNNLTREGTDATKEHSSALGRAFKQFTIYNVAVKAVKSALREAVKTIKELDKYLTEQAMVTGMSREQTYGLVKSYQDLALQCGATTKEIAQVSTEYMKQGKTIQESLVLTEAAVKAAKVARVSVGDSVNYLTTALNGFRLSAKDAMKVSDKFAAVAAASATDYDELAIALSKVASQANLAGMSIDYTTALLTKGLETTREAPETMGTALKTIIARMRELGDYGETLEGDTDLNNVESQLAYVGIALRDANGELRSTEEVLDQLGQKWDTLNKNQQAALAKALAGTRQQSRLIAMMDGYERVIELQQIAERSAGTTAAQADVYLEGMEGAINRVTVAWEKVVMTFTDSEVIIGAVDILGKLLDNLATTLESPLYSWAPIVAIVTAIGKGVGLKLQEWHLSKEQAKFEAERGVVLSRQREEELNALIEKLKGEKEEKKAKLETLLSEKKHTAELKKQTEEQKKQVNLEKVKKGEMTQAEADQANEAIDREIQKIDQQLLEEEVRLRKEAAAAEEARAPIRAKEIQGLQSQLKLQQQLTHSWEAQTNAVLQQGSAMLGYANLAKRWASGIVFSFKNVITTVKKVKEGAMPASAAVIPVFGWIIAAVIEGTNLISTVMSIVVPILTTITKWIGSMGNGAEATTGRINELSDNIYKLTKQADEIDQITDKFDSLDNKLIKTNKDLEEMSSLLEQAGEKLIDEEVGKNEDIGFGKGISAKDYYNTATTDRAKKAALEKISQVSRANANKDREKIIEDFSRMSDADKAEVLSSTDNAQYLKTQDAIFAINNNNLYTYIDELKEAGNINKEAASYVEKFTQNILDNISTTDAWAYASDATASSIKEMVEGLKDITLWAQNAQGEMEEVNITKILTTDDYGLVDQVKAYKEAQNAISALGDEAAMAAFETNFLQYERFTEYSEHTLSFIDSIGLSIDKLNTLYSSWETLQKKGVQISEEVFESRFNEYITVLAHTQGDVLSATETVFGDYLDGSEETLNAFIAAYGDLVQVGILNMGQNMDKINNTINGFYEKAMKWSTLSNNEKAEFIQDNAAMFADNPETAENEGQDLLKAFESGNYESIENALRSNDALQDQIKKRKAEIQQELLIEEARQGADRNEAYIAQLKEYEKYLNDVNNMFKASLELRLEQEKNQLEEYKKFIQEEEQAKIDSINKRKEAYEKYFDKIDEREATEEYEDKAELLVSNLSKLSASDTSEAQKQTKDLENQLKELEKERQKELREQARESVLEDMDDQVEEINDNLEKLLESNRSLLAAMQGRLDDNPQEYIADLIGDKVQSGATANELSEYMGTLQSTYGAAFKDGDLEDIQIKEENNQLILNVNGQEIILDPTNETNLFEAIMAALRQIGLR